MTIWERVASALSSLATAGVPVSANVHLTADGDDLPDEFVTYTLVSNPPEQHADNALTLCSYRVQISYYNRNGLAKMPDIKGLMNQADFYSAGGYELPFDTVTRHYGLALDFFFLESEA